MRARHEPCDGEEEPCGRHWFEWGGYVVQLGALLATVVFVVLPIALAIVGPFLPGIDDNNSFLSRLFDIAVTIANGPLGSDRLREMPGVFWLWGLYWFGLISCVFGFAWLMRQAALWLNGIPGKTSEDDRGR